MNLQLFSISTSVTSPILCNGDLNGAVQATATGGTSPYIYLWSSGSASNVDSFLSAGIYTVSVLDANGCTATSTVEITEPLAIVSNILIASPILCSGKQVFSLYKQHKVLHRIPIYGAMELQRIPTQLLQEHIQL